VIILGLDMSSTCIGYALLGGPEPLWGHQALHGADIGPRCAAAADLVVGLLEQHRPALVVIESPVARFAKAVIPQARVSGAVLAVLAQRRALWAEVTPTRAKQVLCGNGTATKREMTGIRTRHGKVALTDGNHDVLTEDEADAYALALVGQAMRVVTKGAA
jgi:Holliday junction resolvasome RuvABC endonuclease subunit